MTIIGDLRGSIFCKTGCCSDAIFVTKNKANFVKITATWKSLAHELSMRSWTSGPLFVYLVVGVEKNDKF